MLTVSGLKKKQTRKGLFVDIKLEGELGRDVWGKGHTGPTARRSQDS